MKTKKMKLKNKKISGVNKRPVKRSIDVRGKWKAVELDPSLFSEEGLEGLVLFEELTNYRLVDTEKAAAKKELKKKTATKRKAVKKQDAEGKEGESTTEPAKKKAKKTKKKKKLAPKEEDVTPSSEEGERKEASTERTEEDVPQLTQSSKATKKDKKKKNKFKQQTAEKRSDLTSSTELEKSSQPKRTKPLKNKIKNWTNAALSASGDQKCDMGAWKDLFVPSPVLQALSSLGFSSPTHIQALVLPPAIRDRMDILGAAETGKIKYILFVIYHHNNINALLTCHYRKW